MSTNAFFNGIVGSSTARPNWGGAHLFAVRATSSHSEARPLKHAIIGTIVGEPPSREEAATERPSASSLAGISGHTKLESTVRYLGFEVDDALELAEQTEV